MVNFKVVHLQPLSYNSQVKLVAQQLALSKEKYDLLTTVKTKNFLDEEFTGNPKHLITICDRKMSDGDLQIFELLYSLVHGMIKKALVKMDDIGENDDKLATHVRKRRELLVVTNAHMRKLDFLDLELSAETKKLVNNVGILNVTEKIFYLNDLFSEFLVSVYLIHKFRIEGIQADNFGSLLTENYPNQDFTIAVMLLENYKNIFDSLPDDLLYSLNLQNILNSC